MLLVCLALLLGAPADRLPAFTNYVVDRAGVLDPGTVAQIQQTASQLDRAAIAQLAVLTVQPSELGDSSIEEYAAAVFKKWGLGHDKTRSDGILIVFVPGGPGHNRTKVETGYGLEGILPDGKLGALYDQYARPQIRAGNYSEAILRLSDAIAAVIREDAARGGDTAPKPGARGGGRGIGTGAAPESMGGAAVTFFAMGAVVLALLVSAARRRFPGAALKAAAFGASGVSIAALLFSASAVGWIVLIVALILMAVVWASIAQHRCPRDGSWMTIDEVVVEEPTVFSSGLAHVTQRCTNPACGYRNRYEKRLPRKQVTVVTGGGGGWGGGGGGGWGGGGGGGFSGGGGGESGGGGISRQD